MRPSTIWYTLKQGFKNIHRNWMFSTASVLTMAACIFLFGIFYSIVNNVSYIAKSTEEKVPITVFFVEGTTEEQILQIKERIEAYPEVESVIYESADEAWEKFAADYFQDDASVAAGFRDDNPLVNSSNLQISVNDITKQEALAETIASMEGVRNVNQETQAAQTLGSVNRIIYYVSAVVIGVLLLISIFLISNTISVGITVRSEEIGIMKYIGATDRFARAPFVLEGIILGIIGAAIPLIALFFLYQEAIAYLSTRYTVLTGNFSFMTVWAMYETLLPVGLLLGVGIGFIGSYWTTRKHLRV